MFCRDAGMMRRKDFQMIPSSGEEEKRIRPRVKVPGSGNDRRRVRSQRQAMKKVMQQAHWLTATGDTPGLSPGVCFRAARRSYPDALLVVSDILAEAQVRADAGQIGAARRLDGLAEQVALHSGFDELVHLVWAYDSRG